ncbi:hypothetical protein K3495_g15115 [Podosphaera aphanis]|nr:hypothetical protein K3495_g15115 [Podosphaera aphanis]
MPRHTLDKYTYESKRQTTLTEHEVALFANTNNGQKHKPTKHFKPYKITKPKFCRNCKKTSHNANDCYFLFPHKAPKEWRSRPTTTHNKPREMKSYENNNNNTNTNDNIMHSQLDDISAVYTNINLNEAQET